MVFATDPTNLRSDRSLGEEFNGEEFDGSEQWTGIREVTML
jgi:hypothetical protein